MSLTWNDLFLSGSVVGLHTEKWGARLKLRPQDLGIDSSDAVNEALALGAQRLAPSYAFAGINQAVAKARRQIDLYSLSFSWIFGARYVPDQNLKRLTDKLQEARDEFNAAVDQFVADYATIKAYMLPILQEALRAAAKTPEAAELAYQRVLDEYPPPDLVRSSFALDWKVYAIQGATRAGATAALQSEGDSVREVVTEMVKELREEVTQKLKEVLILIQKGGKLRTGTLNSALATLDRIDSVNVLGDGVLTDQVARLRRALRSIDTEQDVPESMVDGLDKIKSVLEADIADAVLSAERNLSGLGRRKLEAV
jgi:hypothetical protein